MPLLLALLSIQLSLAASEPPEERFSDSLEVVEVVVHAVVTDRAGRPVLGLGPADFVVREENRTVEVLSAEYHAWGAARVAALGPRDGPAELQDVVEGRRFILLFHDLRRTDRETLGVASHQLRAGRDARDWLREGLGPGDLAAVVGYDYRLKIHQDFTDDVAALDRAIERAVSRRSEEEAGAAPGAPSLLDRLPDSLQRRDRSAKLRGALELLAEAVATIPGRKNLLLFSVGVGLDGPERGILGRSDDPTLVERLNDSDLAVYCLDTTPPRVEHSLATNLSALAEESGGEYYAHIGHFRGPLRQIERRLRGYYLLTYAGTRAAGGYRRIEVATRSSALVVAARRGYLASGAR